jgi:hypothetical protein
MDIQHPHAESSGSRARSRDSIRNIMKFEIEKHFEALPHNAFNEGGPGGGEQFLANFESA